MSIVMCYVCDARIDSDYEEFHDYIYVKQDDYSNVIAICNHCHEEGEEAND